MSPADNRHNCPASQCEARVGPDMLMCRPHWFMVPKAIRDDVWAAYRGPGPGSDEHTEAIFAAITAVNERLAK